jgi:hypothetical protein
MTKRFFLALPLAALVACGNDNPNPDILSKDVLMVSDIDGLAGWLADRNALKPGPAHSGQYALRVDQDHEFSPGFTTTLGQLTSTRLKGVRLEAWVYATDDKSAAKLEFVLRDAEGKEILRDQTRISEVKSFGTWVPVSKEIFFPPTINHTVQLAVYVSRSDAQTPAFVDDLKLTALR